MNTVSIHTTHKAIKILSGSHLSTRLYSPAQICWKICVQNTQKGEKKLTFKTGTTFMFMQLAIIYLIASSTKFQFIKFQHNNSSAPCCKNILALNQEEAKYLLTLKKQANGKSDDSIKIATCAINAFLVFGPSFLAFLLSKSFVSS